MNEQDELERLRALLEEKERIIKQKDQKIQKQQILIDNMTQALLQARKKQFGASSEKTSCLEQLHLFESVEELANVLFDEQKKITIGSHKRKARKAGVREDMLSKLPKEVVEYVIPSKDECHKCGNELTIIGKEHVRTEVEFVPAKLIVKQIVRQVAKCSDCGKKNSQSKGPVFVKAKVPVPVLPHSISTPSLVAQVMYQKFAMGMPFNRQEKDWYRKGLVLSRADMAYWTIRSSEEWFMPIYDKIHNELLSCEVLHMDETRIQCNKEKGKKASSDSFMWVMRSAACEDIQASYFSYSRSRNTEAAKALIGDYKGYLITDAYAGYNKAGNYDRALCWSHARRYYIESIPLDSKGKEIPGSKGAEGKSYIDLLFKIEKEIKDLSFEEKLKQRQERSIKVLEAYWLWVKETSALYTTNEKLTKALNYSFNQRKNLETFMTDGRIPISNNLCEANIKPYATARRAWLFADSPKGARANAILYTLTESAKINQLDIYEYLKYLLEEMPNNDHINQPDILDKYLPWSSDLPDRCKLEKKTEKHFKS